eukprot:gene20916-43044_t
MLRTSAAALYQAPFWKGHGSHVANKHKLHPVVGRNKAQWKVQPSKGLGVQHPDKRDKTKGNRMMRVATGFAVADDWH